MKTRPEKIFGLWLKKPANPVLTSALILKLINRSRSGVGSEIMAPQKSLYHLLKWPRYFASDGWDDITIAFPLNIRQLSEIEELASDVNLGILIETIEAAQALGLRRSSRFNIWIKIDCGLHRAGVDWQDTPRVHAIIKEVQKFPNLHPAGLLTHAGNTYSARSPEEALSIHTETNKRMRQLRENLGIPELSISIGDTPGCSLSKFFTGIDEIRPGNFIFYDAEQLEIGSCRPEEITVAMACRLWLCTLNEMKL
jgi:D-serine deaminase-like pyridoxal phosphate-dependent protein